MSEPEHISPEEFDRTFPHASQYARDLNRKAWATAQRVQRILGEPRQYHPLLDGPAEPIGLAMRPPKAKRIRQDSKPLLNKLEERFAQKLVRDYRGISYRAQAKRYRLANGIWYKPDFTAIVDGTEHAWECKGPKAFRGGFENLKVAASTFPEVVWHLVWEENGEHNNWKEQTVLP